MSKICQVTGKKPTSGHKISHSNIKTKRRFEPNLHTKRFWVPTENRFVRLTVSAHGLRIIDKKGIEVVLKEIQERSDEV
jgi:large subunit ribosomal protein L28